MQPNTSGTVCANCNAPLMHNDKSCARCAFPAGGPEAEQQEYNYMKGYAQLQLDSAKKYTTYSIATIAMIGIYQAASGLIIAGRYGWDHTVAKVSVMVYGIVALFFIALAVWAWKKPYLATLIALILFGVQTLLFFILNPGTLIDGIIWKIGFFCLLGYELQLHRKTEDIKATYHKMHQWHN
jgi:hypothetical protein